VIIYKLIVIVLLLGYFTKKKSSRFVANIKTKPTTIFAERNLYERYKPQVDGFGGLVVSMLASGTRVRALDFFPVW
jgi:hypothetical protein